MYTRLQEEIIQFTEELISIRSYEGQPGELSSILDVVLSKIPRNFRIEKFESQGIKSALVYAGSQRPEKFRILFNCHLDIIPGKEAQYTAYHDADRLYGAGANDMKGNVVATLFAFLECAGKLDYPIALQLVTDEEVGGFHGTKFQVENGVQAEFVIATEPTNLDIVIKAKGVLWCKIESRGKAAHGAYPWRGDNAIEKITSFLTQIKDIVPNPEQEEWASTLNIAKIETENQVFNKIPDSCSVFLDIRFIPYDDIRILTEIQAILTDDFIFSVIEHEPAICTKEDNDILVSLTDSINQVGGTNPRLYGANGTSDARHFAAIGASGIEFGSVGGGIGEDEEWVSISGLEDYYNILMDFLRKQNGLQGL